MNTRIILLASLVLLFLLSWGKSQPRIGIVCEMDYSQPERARRVLPALGQFTEESSADYFGWRGRKQPYRFVVLPTQVLGS